MDCVVTSDENRFDSSLGSSVETLGALRTLAANAPKANNARAVSHFQKFLGSKKEKKRK